MVRPEQAGMAEATPKGQTILMDPGVLVADPRWNDYYKYHVVLHEERARQQLALPEQDRDPYWFMLMELDAEASVLWALTH